MKIVALDEKWTFRRGFLDSLAGMKADPGVDVNLPHDGMIGTDVSADAPSNVDSAYYKGDQTNYTKSVFIPKEWENDSIGLQFDGAMMNVTVDINGYRVGKQNYGYAPFYVDLTDYIAFGEENRIIVNVNTSMYSNSRWYTGSGLFRGVKLCHGPKVHVVTDGIYVYTKTLDVDYAFLEAQIEVENATSENRLAKVDISITEDGKDEILAKAERVIQINPRSTETAIQAVNLKNPKLWSAETPNLYKVKVSVSDIGVYRTHFTKSSNVTVDEADTLFGVRTITADSIHGLRINGKETKLKGGCVHHDNGLLGAVSFYEIEARRVKKLKEVGFNAIRTAHNPPSAALIEACDRLGMYVFDEAFDSWGIAKRSGDYSRFFENDWQKDLTAFVKRDRSHPCVIMWSTGNEIPERGGLGNGYTLAAKLANAFKELDRTRPVSNGICSLWSGLDDELAEGKNQEQNSADGLDSNQWETVTEPFTNGMDIVGYNYMEDLYERDHEMFPERVILGSENYPKEIGFRWPMVESHPYVIGDFTWTAWDYLGESGIGKAVYVEPGNPLIEKGPWAIMPMETSPYPWRTANCGDFDINGHMLPQGAYRSVVWGSDRTFLYTRHPDTFDKVELMSMWGFPSFYSDWNYKGYEGKPVKLTVFSKAEEVEVIINGRSLGKKAVNRSGIMPDSVDFDVTYEPGTVVAISFSNGNEVSRDTLVTAGEPATIALLPEKETMKADGHDLIYVGIEIRDKEGNIVPNASIPLNAKVSGSAFLAGFGSGNPVTEENYTDNQAVTYRGRATLIIRSGYESGPVELSVSADGFEKVNISLTCTDSIR
ncbi:MAG: DUF4982 domain-containing protein [Eubacterium sp.]|nr:DUF4982 domain-containing protein [Eubacterium sp.]